MILALVNTVAVIAALGMLVYTRVLFKRPTFTEAGERKKLADAPPKASPYQPGLITFEALTVNIKPIPSILHSKEMGQPNPGTAQYATVGFSFEVRDMGRKDQIESLKPVINDKVLGMLARKDMAELTTVQGRYVLRTQIMDTANALLTQGASNKDNVVTNVYFNEFVVQ